MTGLGRFRAFTPQKSPISLFPNNKITIRHCLAISGFIGYAFVDRTWIAFALMGAIALQTLVQPSLMAILSRRATPETHGEVQGIAAMAMGLGSLIAPLLFNPAMAYFTAPAAPVRFAGIAFILAALVAALAFVALLRLPRAQMPPRTGG